MTSMEITTVIGCRVECDFCPQELLMDKYSSKNNINNITYGTPVVMTFEVFKECVDKLPKHVSIIFAGYGEGWLAPDCTKMLIYAYDSGHPVQAYSTLVGMTLEDVDRFKHIPFDIFHIHLPDSSNYAKIAVNEYYLKVLKKILTSNISNVTAMTMGELHPKIKKILKTNVLPSKMGSRSGNVKKVKVEIDKKLGPLSCGRATGIHWEDKLDANVLLPNGDVTICCHDYGLQNIIGNLLNTDYHSLFQTDSFKQIREKMKAEDSDIICRYCIESVSEDSLNEKRAFMDNILLDKSFDGKIVALLIDIYKNLLKRAPDPEGFNFYYSKILNHEMTLHDLESSIKQSSEYFSYYDSVPERTKISLIDDISVT